jgi:hypothetical protein
MKVSVYLEIELILFSLYMGECMNKWTNIHVALQFLTNWFCSKLFGSSITINILSNGVMILILSYQLKYEHAYVIIFSINDLKLSGWIFEIVTHEMLL